MLIGAELFWRLVCAGQIQSSRSQPTLQKTLLGWIISGPTTNKMSSSGSPLVSYVVVNEDLNHAINRFWEIDHALSAHEESPEGQACEHLFKKTVKRNNEGRFIVQLPIKADKLMNLGGSLETATRRFNPLEKRLTRSPKMYAEYRHFLKKYLELGHMREITDPSQEPDKVYYFPHHAVYKETSTITKLRVIFYGSCKTSTGISLNDALMVGPTIHCGRKIVSRRSFLYTRKIPHLQICRNS